MKLVPYDTLIHDVAGIQPNIAWLLANVPRSIPLVMSHSPTANRSRVVKVLEDLQLKYAELQGKILELESRVVELEVGDVQVVMPEGEEEDLAFVEDALRTALDKVIDYRKQEKMEPISIGFKLTPEDVGRWKAMYETMMQGLESGISVQEAIEETTALKAVKAAVTTQAENMLHEYPHCEGCPEYDFCGVPDIDLDGQPLD